MIQTKTNNDFGFIFGLHLSVIIFWYLTPILFSWYWLIIGVAFSYAQGFLINGCILTHAQFGKESQDTFWGYYLRKLGIGLNKKLAKIIFFWLEPLVVLLIALISQKYFSIVPFVI